MSNVVRLCRLPYLLVLLVAKLHRPIDAMDLGLCDCGFAALWRALAHNIGVLICCGKAATMTTGYRPLNRSARIGSIDTSHCSWVSLASVPPALSIKSNIGASCGSNARDSAMASLG
jgi:hypothetical protein